MFEAFCIAVATLCLWGIADRLTEIRDELRTLNRRDTQNSATSPNPVAGPEVKP
jgi:hypothetical protein